MDMQVNYIESNFDGTEIREIDIIICYKVKCKKKEFPWNPLSFLIETYKHKKAKNNIFFTFLLFYRKLIP